MRALAMIFALFVAAPPAVAADWKEYAYPEHSFTVHFPAEPQVESATYHGPGGRPFNARVYSLTQDTGVFRMTVADLPAGAPDEKALLSHAITTLSEGGEIKIDIPHRIRQVYGRQLGIAGTNGGFPYVAVFYRDKRLYQIEGKSFVRGGQAELDAMIFQQSLDFT